MLSHLSRSRRDRRILTWESDSKAAAKYAADPTRDPGAEDTLLPITFFMDLAREHEGDSTMRKAFIRFATLRIADEVPNLPRYATTEVPLMGACSLLETKV